ncbi:heat shock protein 30-like [Scomber scombrus]|uniref:Heat shock protein 30-like n=1 Tax=Scomber scombrus TaxID=13677 RepID=A0AAV1NRG2_SCOSC
MTRKFLKTLVLLQLEYKSWDSPTAETESNTTNTEENRHFHSLSSHNKRTQHTEDAVLSWTPVYSQSIHGLLLACTQSVARRQTSALPAGSVAEKPPGAAQQSGDDGQTLEHFGLTLDTQGFSPEELSVRQVGRKLRVSGKTEKKQEDGKGCYSYRCQEFRQEFDLPEELNPEAITCYLAPDGKLHIQEAKALCVDEAERELPIETSSEEKPQQSVCSHTEDSSTETDDSTQDKPANMD